MIRRLIVVMLAVLAPQAANAAGLEGEAMGVAWELPFIGVLLSITAGPVLFKHLWHDHYGKIAAAWALLTLAPIALVFGLSTAFDSLLHAILGEYVSFVVLLFALYVIAGGILVTGSPCGTPAADTASCAVLLPVLALITFASVASP